LERTAAAVYFTRGRSSRVRRRGRSTAFRYSAGDDRRVYVLRFFFDYGGTCLWAANDLARERFGYPVELSELPIPDDLRHELQLAGERFDTSLNWDNPAGPSPWSKEDSEQFTELTDCLLDRLRVALGPSFEIRDERGGATAE
jgi:hypothetical protein